jgi:hypothetical protein
VLEVFAVAEPGQVLVAVPALVVARVLVAVLLVE